MKKSILALSCVISSLVGCQLISPIFVDYNGVRRDVAQWINGQTLLSMQQKRSLAQLSKAQQPIVRLNLDDSTAVHSIAKNNQIALQCAQIHHVSANKIKKLQEHIFNPANLEKLKQFEQVAPKFKLDAQSIQCE